MPKITLAQAKAHQRLDLADTSEDALIGIWLSAAYLAVQGEIFRKVYDAEGDIPADDLTGLEADDAINAAALLIFGHLYSNREAVVQGQAVEVPMGAKWLLTQHINHEGGA